jgi:hypothetical protein
MAESPKLAGMIGLFCFVLAVLASPFKSKLRLEVENAVLRHQLIVLRRRLHGRVRLTNHDRWFFIQLYRSFPCILQVRTIIRPETLLTWRRAGFRRYWRWKSRRRGGRPPVETELRAPHLRRIPESYALYYNETRTHFALDRDAPLSRTVKRAGRILCRPILGGLHHEYVRI